MQICIQTDSPQATRAVGQMIGQVMPAGTVLAAEAELGAGKTVLAQGLAAGLGISEPVTSPTFIYYAEYAGRLPFCHIDAYRLEHLEEEELALVGLEECFLPSKTVFVEWPQFIPAFLPPETIALRISRSQAAVDSRLLCFHFLPAAQPWLAALLAEHPQRKGA